MPVEEWLSAWDNGKKLSEVYCALSSTDKDGAKKSAKGIGYNPRRKAATNLWQKKSAVGKPLEKLKDLMVRPPAHAPGKQFKVLPRLRGGLASATDFAESPPNKVRNWLVSC